MSSLTPEQTKLLSHATRGAGAHLLLLTVRLRRALMARFKSLRCDLLHLLTFPSPCFWNFMKEMKYLRQWVTLRIGWFKKKCLIETAMQMLVTWLLLWLRVAAFREINYGPKCVPESSSLTSRSLYLWREQMTENCRSNCVAEMKNPEETRESKGCWSSGHVRKLYVGGRS